MRIINFLFISLLAVLLQACSTQSLSSEDHDALAAEIRAMAQDDQRLDQLVVRSDPETRETGFFKKKEQLQRERTARAREIFELVGFPTAPAFDASASSDFWLLVQHSDNDPAFQQRVLEAIDKLPDGTVSLSERAYLVDRVRINTHRPQRFGTQTAYDFEQARAFPKALEDPKRVDDRRASQGLEPLWEYMNALSELNYSMNKKLYESKGITRPWRYPDGYSDW